MRFEFWFFVLTAVAAPDISLSLSSSGGIGIVNNASYESEVPSRSFIEITNINDIGRKESLPASFIESWPNWFIEDDGSFSRIPDDQTPSGSGFVSPTSIDQLFQPVDLKPPQMKIALGMHIRGGEIRHVFPALDISYGNGLHRNRGLCSVPLAYNWVDFGYLNSLGDFNRYKLTVSSRKRDGDESSWSKLNILQGCVMSKAIERAIVCLAEADSDDLGVGSHIIHVALDDADTFDMPKSKNDLRVTILEDGDEGEEDNDIGILEVAIVAAMSGSDSEYLPKAYRPLYDDETLRNPLYEKFKRRKASR